ncbi:MAG: hypothetical protein AAB433_20930, partial [Nitrospirota bacterium]
VQDANAAFHRLRVFCAHSVGMRCHGLQALHRVGLPWGVQAETPNTYGEVVTMRIPRITQSGVVVLTVVLFAALSIRSTQPVQAADLLMERAVGFAPLAERGVMASGAVEDTLKACMARIPALASAGQRMLAEQSCAGEDEVRKTLRSAPKF